jgi:hypothetical protein
MMKPMKKLVMVASFLVFVSDDAASGDGGSEAAENAYEKYA